MTAGKRSAHRVDAAACLAVVSHHVVLVEAEACDGRLMVEKRRI
jgi:hypothetical protein